MPVVSEVLAVMKEAVRPGEGPARKAVAESAADTRTAECAFHVATKTAAASKSSAHMSAESPAHVTSSKSATKAAVSSPTSPAARERIGSQPASESGRHRQNDYCLT
jgi:hypothetical protein